MKRVFAVTGATGNVGSVVAETLLANGHQVRAIGRSSERLNPLTAKGADVRVGSLGDVAFLTEAFRGAEGVFAMIPPQLKAADFAAYQAQIAKNLAQAATDGGVSKVVALSSIGAQWEKGTGPIKGLHRLEEILNELHAESVVNLRPTFFMENLLMGIPAIKSMGVNGGAAPPDAPVPMIATRDIGVVAAQALEQESSGKVVRELLGPKEYSMREATAILGRAIDKPDLQYVQLPLETIGQALRSQGLSENVVGELLEMYEGMNQGLIRPTEARRPENTTPTTLEEFSETFARAYQTAAVAGA
jgi:uncharacterized protein YbjT (DUF2867 family)